MRYIFQKGILLFYLIICCSISYAQNCTHHIEGKITEFENKEPVLFAQIQLKELQKSVLTDEKGNYHFDNICNGTYTLEISHIECLHETRLINVSNEGAIINIELHHDNKLLKEVSVTVQAITAKTTQASATLEGTALDATRGQSLGDALKNIAGVTTLNTGATVAKPVIQGMHSNRILIFNNGVRQEGQQWGLDHAPEIDPFTADKISVVKGAASVIYGADAIGGIVLLEPRALRKKEGIGGEFNLAGFSNGRSGVVAATLDGCFFCHTDGFSMDDKRKFSWRLQGSLKKAGNLRTPNYYLANTGIEEKNYSATIEHRGTKMANNLFFSHFSSDIGIFKGAHIGNLADLKEAFTQKEPLPRVDFTYQIGRPVQQISHNLLKYKNSLQVADNQQLVTQLSIQNNRRGEFDAHRLFGTLSETLDKPNLLFSLFSAAINSTFNHHIKDNIHGKGGVEYTYQKNTTEKGGLIPNYVNMNGAAFLTERWHTQNSKITVEGGIRYDYRWLNTRVRNTSAGENSPLQQFRYQSFAGQLGGIYKVTEDLRFSYNLGSAWRAPSVNELFSLGVHHGTASFERGNPELKNERSVNNSLSAIYDKENLKIQVDLYVNFIKNYVYLKPDTIAVQTIRGAFPAFDFKQADTRLTGMDWNIEWNVLHNLTLESKGSLLRAWNLSEAKWLILMPSDRFQQGIKYLFKDKNNFKNTFLGINNNIVLRQNRVPENQDYAISPKGYVLFGAEIGTSVSLFKNPLTLSFSVKNMGNKAYRDYLNRFRYFADEIGRDVQLRVKYVF